MSSENDQNTWNHWNHRINHTILEKGWRWRNKLLYNHLFLIGILKSQKVSVIVISVISLETFYFCNQKELFKKLDMWKYLRFEIFPILGFLRAQIRGRFQESSSECFQWNHRNNLKKADFGDFGYLLKINGYIFIYSGLECSNRSEII